MPAPAGRASRPLMPYKWEWVGAPERKSDGLMHYRACRQIFREDPTDCVVYSVGDIIFCGVEGDPMPWVAQITGFVFDPSISATAVGGTENENGADKEKDGDDSESESSEPPPWMPMRVCLRWLYRLSDVVEDKGRNVPGHPCEVFVSDHVTGPEVNSVNIIDGRAILTQDESRVPAKCELNADGERVYLCRRFYRHDQATKPPRSMFPKHANVRVKTVRMLAPGELENIMKNPTDSIYLFYKHASEDKATGRRSGGRPRAEDRARETDGNRATGSSRKKRKLGVESDDNTDDERDDKRAKKDGSQSAPHARSGANAETTSLRPRRRSSIAASQKNRDLRRLYVEMSSEDELDDANQVAGGRKGKRSSRNASGSSRTRDEQEGSTGNAKGDGAHDASKNGETDRAAAAGAGNGRDATQADGGSVPTGVPGRGGAAPRSALVEHMLPADVINKAFADLTDEQRRACRRNMPWIVDSMQVQLVAAGKVATDEMFANVVKNVMHDYENLVAEQERSRGVDGAN